MNFIDRYFRSSTTLYEKGLDFLYGLHGKVIDIEETYRLWTLASNMGNITAQKAIAHIFEPDKPVLRKSFEESYEMLKALKLAEEAGDPEACYLANVSKLDDDSDGYTYKKGMSAIRYAASRNHPPALYKYGCELEKGTRIPQNREEAERLLKLSASMGYAPAIETLYYAGDSALAKRYAEEFARSDNPEVMDLLGDIMTIEGDHNRAIELYEQAASFGNTNAMCSLGYHALKGDICPKDFYSAAMWFQRASDEGHLESTIRLAFMMKNGPEEFRDAQGAFSLFLKAARAGKTVMWNEVGDCYKEGFGVSPSPEKALKCYLKAADCSTPGNAYFKLFVLYRDGRAMEQNLSEAMKWLDKAAQTGYPVACWHYGLHYKLGIGLDSDFNNAYRWFKVAAEKDFPPALYELGLMYLAGVVVEKDEREAFKLFKVASDDYPPAMDELGHCYSRGVGCEQNYMKAFNCYSMAAHEGNEEAMFDLGICYRYGEGVEQDFEKAIEWYERAIELGHSGAMTNCAILYDTGIGVEQNCEYAYQLYKRAAEIGNVQAQFCLGSMYFDGRFVEQDYSEAVKWFSEAAKSGEPDSMFHLAMCYNDGLGVEQDSFRAVQYLYDSADHGWQPAIDFIKEHNIPRLDADNYDG